MGEPEKPFACTLPECGMTFTNEDHLHVHTKKHDMVLQLGSEQKAAFVADQTPTPTRFIRNCEEVGLFQDLQNVNVNPFDEGFKRAMETKHGIMSLDSGVVTSASDDVLHTPQMVFPLIDAGDSTLYSTTNNQRNITISRSSSDESGSIKEYETTTISKLTNEVTTISRIVGKQDILDKITTTDDVSIVKHQELGHNKDLVNETSVSYTNNVIKIHSNVEIRKDSNVVNIETSKPVTLISYKDSVTRDATSVVTKDVLLTDSNRLQIPQVNIPIMSQRSIDFVVDSLAAECENQIEQRDERMITVVNNSNTLHKNQVKAATPKRNDITVFNTSNKHKRNRKIGVKKEHNDYEVFLKLPNGKRVRMKAVEDRNTTEKHKVIEDETKTKLKRVLAEKCVKKTGLDNSVLHRPSSLDGSRVPNILPLAGGTFYPVTIVSPISVPVPKIPIVPLNLGKFNRPSETLKKFVKIKDKNNVNASEVPKDNLLKETVDHSKSVHNISDNISLRDKIKYVNTGVSTDNSSNLNVMKKNGYRLVDNPVKTVMESRSAASRRYRFRLKEKMLEQSKEITKLKELNDRLLEENYYWKDIINKHLKICSNGDLLKNLQKDPLEKGKS